MTSHDLLRASIVIWGFGDTASGRIGLCPREIGSGGAQCAFLPPDPLLPFPSLLRYVVRRHGRNIIPCAITKAHQHLNNARSLQSVCDHQGEARICDRPRFVVYIFLFGVPAIYSNHPINLPAAGGRSAFCWKQLRKH